MLPILEGSQQLRGQGSTAKDISSIQEVLSGQSKVRSSVLALHNFAPGTLC